MTKHFFAVQQNVTARSHTFASVLTKIKRAPASPADLAGPSPCDIILRSCCLNSKKDDAWHIAVPPFAISLEKIGLTFSFSKNAKTGKPYQVLFTFLKTAEKLSNVVAVTSKGTMLDTTDQDWASTPKENNEDWALSSKAMLNTVDRDWAPSGILKESQAAISTNATTGGGDGAAATAWAAIANCGCTTPNFVASRFVSDQFPYKVPIGNPEEEQSSKTSENDIPKGLPKNVTAYSMTLNENQKPKTLLQESRDEVSTSRGTSSTQRTPTENRWTQRVNKARGKKQQEISVSTDDVREPNVDFSALDAASDKYSLKDDSVQARAEVRRARSRSRNPTPQRDRISSSQPRRPHSESRNLLESDREPSPNRRGRSRSRGRGRDPSAGRVSPPMNSKAEERGRPRSPSPRRRRETTDSANLPSEVEDTKLRSTRSTSPSRQEKLTTVTLVEKRTRSRSRVRSTKNNEAAEGVAKKAAQELARSMEKVAAAKAQQKIDELKVKKKSKRIRNDGQMPRDLEIPVPNQAEPRPKAIVEQSDTEAALKDMLLVGKKKSESHRLEETGMDIQETEKKALCSPCTPRPPAWLSIGADEEKDESKSSVGHFGSHASYTKQEEGIEMVPFVSNNGAPGLMIVSAGEWLLADNRKVRSKSPAQGKRAPSPNRKMSRPQDSKPNGRRRWPTMKYKKPMESGKTQDQEKYPTIKVPKQKNHVPLASKKRIDPTGESPTSNNKVDVSSLGEVIDAVTKFRGTAAKLGMSEQDLLDAISTANNNRKLSTDPPIMTSSSVSSLTKDIFHK